MLPKTSLLAIALWQAFIDIYNRTRPNNKCNKNNMRHDVGAFVSVGVGVGERQSEDSFVCFGTKPTQWACARDFPRDRKKTRKGKVPKQSTEVGERRRSEKGGCRARRWDLWAQMPGQPTREDESVFLVAVWEFR